MICLINLPSPALAQPWSNFPLGIGYVAAALEKRGIKVNVMDFCEGLPQPFAIEKASIYGLSVVSPQVKTAKKVAAKIKALYPQALVVAGGPHTLVGKEDFLGDENFDSVVVEEGEFSFFELIRHYELYGQIERTYWNPPIKLLDDVPFPARHLFADFKKNALRTKQLLKKDYTEGGQTTIIASRGCPYQCSFCAPHPRKVRYRSPENVVSEIKQIIDEFGIYQFKFQDDTFTLNRKWVLQLCDLIKKQLPPVFMRVHTRVNVFDEDMAAAMWSAGVRILCFGIESFSQRVLDLNFKSITIDMVEAAFALAKKYQFKTVGFLIYGLPGENRDSVEQTKRGILRNKRYLDYLNLATMVPLIGTPVYNNPDKFDCKILSKDPEDLWIVDHEASDSILIKTNGVSLAEAVALKKDMYHFMREQGYSRPEWRK